METNTPEDIQRQQADLQAKILSLLGSSAVVPSSSSSTTPTSASMGSSSSKPVGNYDSPSGRGTGGPVSYPQQSGYGSAGRGYANYGAQSDGYRGGGGYGAYGGYQ